MTDYQTRERSFMQDGSDGYAIYQLSDKPENHFHRFARLSELESPVQKDNYDLVYTGMLDSSTSGEPLPILEQLYMRFNLDRPDDFHGHSLSVSDVIVLKLGHEIKSYYTDSFGFKELPGFIPDDNPLRNAEMNVEDDMNMIDGIINNGSKQDKDHPSVSDLHPDRPIPDNGPDERSVRFYSHDYPADTTLEYTRTGDRAEIRLSFSSEDPDMGTEEMIYAGENGESLHELVADLRAELTGFLDAEDTSSFVRQQGLSEAFSIHDAKDYYEEYSRTALYAFEALLRETEKERPDHLVWKPMDPEKTDWLYSGNSDEDKARGCIGHLRGDFGRDGNEFWTSWFDHQPTLNTETFRRELQGAVEALRREGGLLQNFSSMNKQCRDRLRTDDSFGFRAESKDYQYCLRCLPQRGNYNFYLYAYDKNAQREHSQDQSLDIGQRAAKPRIKKNEMER